MDNLFGSLATDLAKNASSGFNPGSMISPGAGNATQNKPGLFGLGGPGTGIIDKFSGLLGGMFGGGGGASANAMPKYAAGGGVSGTGPGGDNPYTAQVTALDNQIQTIKNSIVKTIPKEQWEQYMAESVMPLMQKRQELAVLSSQWDADPNNQKPVNQNQQQAPNMQVNPPVNTGQPGTGNQTEFGPAKEAKVRKITIEEKPGNVETQPSNN